MLSLCNIIYFMAVCAVSYPLRFGGAVNIVEEELMTKLIQLCLFLKQPLASPGSAKYKIQKIKKNYNKEQNG